MLTNFEKVLYWHRRAAPEQVQEYPAMPDPDRAQHRVDLIAEEFAELQQAIDDNDLVAIADALGDLEYVIDGTYLAFGMNGDAIFNEVHRSNMTKIGPDGSVEKSPTGKVLKGPYYDPPHLARRLLVKLPF